MTGGEPAHDLNDLLHKVTYKYHGEPGVQRLRRRSVEERKEIKKNFAESVALADKINSDDSLSFSAEYNHIAVMTAAEKAALVGHMNVSSAMERERRQSGPPPTMLEKRGGEADEPKEVDWVARGAQWAVKNQGSCGSCWTFGAVSPFEGNYYITTGEKQMFSEQEYLDCAYEGRDGCQGGWMSTAYSHNMNTDHMSLSTDVRYQGRSSQTGSSKCQWLSKPNGLKKAKYSGSTTPRGDKALQTAVSTGVVAVAIMATSSFSSYRSGVYVCTDTNCKESINHAVSVVGYGVQSGIRYWKVRNSWGARWGDGGYIKMTRDDAGKGKASTNGVINIHKYGGTMPHFKCRDGQTCKTPEWNEDEHEEDDIEVNKGNDTQCGVLRHSGGRCVSIDDSSEKMLDMSIICERTWCATTLGFLYEKATDLCANIVEPKKCEDKSDSCGYYKGKGYCKHTYQSYMEETCPRSCGLCKQARIRLQGNCNTTWTITNGTIEAKDGRRFNPYGSSATPIESTPIIPEAKGNATFEFVEPQCWEVEEGKKLSGALVPGCKDKLSSCSYWESLGYCVGRYAAYLKSNCKSSCKYCSVIKTVTKEADAKEGCKERGDTCGGVNYVASIGKYQLVPGTVLAAAAATDKAMALVSCNKACNTGEKRCMDGDCRADCGTECDTAAGIRKCPDGTCKHKHMAC